MTGRTAGKSTSSAWYPAARPHSPRRSTPSSRDSRFRQQLFPLTWSHARSSRIWLATAEPISIASTGLSTTAWQSSAKRIPPMGPGPNRTRQEEEQQQGRKERREKQSDNTTRLGSGDRPAISDVHLTAQFRHGENGSSAPVVRDRPDRFHGAPAPGSPWCPRKWNCTL